MLYTYRLTIVCGGFIIIPYEQSGVKSVHSKKIMLIINPVAGKMKIKSSCFDIVNTFYNHGYEVAVFPTQKKGHAACLAQQCEAYDMVVCCGGDGTLCEVTNGMMRLPPEKRSPLGYIPAGSTNDLAAGLGLSKNIIKASEFAAVNSPRGFDVGSFNDKFFNYVAAFGAFTEASYSTKQNIKNMFGHFAYVVEGTKHITAIKPFSLRFKYDNGEEEGDYVFGAVLNSTSMGGILKFKKEDISYNDGFFEVLLIRMPANLVQLQQITNALLKKEYGNEYISFFRTSALEIESGENLAWTLDGEMEISKRQVNIKNNNNAISLVY